MLPFPLTVPLKWHLATTSQLVKAEIVERDTVTEDRRRVLEAHTRHLPDGVRELLSAVRQPIAEAEDFSKTRVERFVRFVSGEPLREFSGKYGVVEEFSDRVEPFSAGLRDRLWYGAESLDSAVWAGEHGLNLLTSSVVFPQADQAPDFATVQASQIRAFRQAAAEHAPMTPARVSQGLVVIPTDTATAHQKAKYQAYVDERMPRTRRPQGPTGMLFAKDLIGSSEEIAAQLTAHAGFREVNEVAFALPFSFEHEDYVQNLTDIATRLGPLLGWSPTIP